MGIVPLQAELRFDKKVIEASVEPDVKSYAFEFPFENAGSAPITITEISTSCGCTVAELEKKEYAPGENGVIKGSISVGGKKGVQRQSVYVKTSEDSKERIGLQLAINVPELLEIKPGVVFWRKGSQPEIKEIQLVPNADYDLKIKSVESEHNLFGVELVDEEASQVLAVVPVNTAENVRDTIRIHAEYKGVEKQFVVHAMVR